MFNKYGNISNLQKTSIFTGGSRQTWIMISTFGEKVIEQGEDSIIYGSLVKMFDFYWGKTGHFFAFEVGAWL